MKIADWIGGAGVIVLLSIVTAALLPDSLWERRSMVSGNPVAAMQVGEWNGVPVPSVAPGQPQAVTVAGTRTTLPQPGLMPFEQAPSVRFAGKIQQITEVAQNDRQIHIWVHDATGRELHISVGPGWFLEYMGCTLSHDLQVSGVGFQFDRQMGVADPVIYVQKFQINGKQCRLRNDEGFALWSNRLR